MFKKLKKAFTIVELVIVIAVIAILAAVLIPTFVNIIEKANLSNDQQVARTLNVALQLESVNGEPEDMGDVCNMLKAEGYSFTTISPKSSGCIYAWDKTTNTILLINGDGEVIYTEDSYSSSDDVHILVTSLDNLNDYNDVVSTYSLANSVTLSSNVDAGAKTLDLNGYVLDVSPTSVTITVGSVINGFVTDTAKTALGSEKLSDSVRTVSVNGSSESGADLTNLTVSNSENTTTISNTQMYFKQHTYKFSGSSGEDTSTEKHIPSNKLVIENCIFDGDKKFTISNFDEVVISGCIFRINDGDGTVLLQWIKNITVENCTFEGQRGLHISESSSGKELETLNITGNYFSIQHSKSATKGYAIQLADQYYSDNVKINVENNNFALCGVAVKLHVTVFTGCGQQNNPKYDAAAVSTLESWIAKNGSWISMKNNTYGTILHTQNICCDEDLSDPNLTGNFSDENDSSITQESVRDKFDELVATIAVN